MRYYIFTYGCQMNKSDSEKIASILENRGYKLAATSRKADLIVLNACSVRQSAIDRIYGQIQNLVGKKIIVAGCLLEKDKKILKEKVEEIWHPDSYFEACTSPLKIRGGRGELSPINYIPIMTGCNNFCSYCAVPYARGREKSRLAGEIIDEVKSLIAQGYKKIVLLGQNVNSYKSSTDYRLRTTEKKLFPEQGAKRRIEGSRKIYPSTPPLAGGSVQEVNFSFLLKTINSLPGSFRLSFLTSHPKDMSDELIKTIAQCEKLIKELHLPIQSGDDTILRKMNRHYTTAYYKNLIKKIRRAIPNIKISTDIIVGFPGETKKQFENTVKLCRAVKFNKAFIAKYSPRPGTAAARLKDNVPAEEKKRRWRILDTLINKYEHQAFFPLLQRGARGDLDFFSSS